MSLPSLFEGKEWDCTYSRMASLPGTISQREIVPGREVGEVRE